MADYSINTPASLDGIDPLTPDGATEDASQLDDAIRQAKSLFKSVLLKEHEADGTHKSVATSLAAKSITSDKIANDTTDNTKRAIGTDHIKDGAVTKEKMSIDSLDGAKLVAGSVTSDKIGNQAITEEKLALGSVGAEHLKPDAVQVAASDSISETALQTNAVTETKIKDKAVSAAKLNLAEGLIPVGGASGAVAAQVGGNLELTVDETTNPPTANFRILSGSGTLLPIFILNEGGSTGGAAGAFTWNRRPVSPSAFSLVFDGSSLIQLQSRSIIFKVKGSYLIWLQAVGFKVNFHQIRLRDLGSGATLLLGMLSEADAAGSTQSATTAFGMVTIVEDNTEVIVEHYTNSADANGLGKAPGTANGETAIYLQMIGIKVA